MSVDAAVEKCLDIGRRFHAQLEALLPQPNHPDDDAHDIAVGSAVLAVISGESADSIEAVYNAWAETSGYAPIQYLGTWRRNDGETFVCADIVTARIGIAQSSGDVFLMENLCR